MTLCWLSILYLVVFLTAVIATRPPDAPRPTLVAHDTWSFDGWSPAPTPPPAYARYDLRRNRRQDSSFYTSATGNVCGWLNANYFLDYACSTTATCTTDDSNDHFCCVSGDDANCGQVPTSCWDSTNAGYCTGDCSTGPSNRGMVCSDGANPYCGLILLWKDVGNGAYAAYPGFFCNSDPVQLDFYQSATVWSNVPDYSKAIDMDVFSNYINPTAQAQAASSATADGADSNNGATAAGGDKLSYGAKIGTIAGSAAGVLGLFVSVFMCCRRTSRGY